MTASLYDPGLDLADLSAERLVNHLQQVRNDEQVHIAAMQKARAEQDLVLQEMIWREHRVRVGSIVQTANGDLLRVIEVKPWWVTLARPLPLPRLKASKIKRDGTWSLVAQGVYGGYQVVSPEGNLKEVQR